MDLDADHIASLARLLAPADPGSEACRLAAALEAGQLDRADFRVAIVAGEVIAAVQVHPLGAGRYTALIRGARSGVRREVDGLLVEAARRADDLGARQLMLRIPEGWQDERLGAVLSGAGFRCVGWRLSYGGMLLPQRSDSVFAWRRVEPTAILELLARASEGDPLAPDPSEEWAGAPGLVTEVHVGAQAGEDRCVGIVQVDPRSGWCQVGYVGVVPGARGLGLGRAAHAFLLGRLAALGGTHWEGGCGERNGAMRRILESVGHRTGRALEWRRAGSRQGGSWR